MKKSRQLIVILLMTLVCCGPVAAQKQYKYRTFENDPMGVREYTLDNGLKVYMSVYKNAPRIQTYIAVRAGSKNDPKETTGLAHYLEHMMFKGSQKLGTSDWERESALIQRIEGLFEGYRQIEDSALRASVYHLIDSLSYEASKIAIANEYDKAMSAIGSQGTNAFTSNDYTMYVESIPSNQLEAWCEIEADRFQNLVLRLFHTELETIYEEKNMSLTKDSRKMNDTMLAVLFPHHPYGQQTTLGRQEHLKNPSMLNIRNFVAQYYVPNNMCISMAGDFDPDEAIRIIDKYWGEMKPVAQKPFVIEPEAPITSVITKNVVGLEAESTRRAYRLEGGCNGRDALLGDLMQGILYNGKCGLIDLNVNQQQRCMIAYAFNNPLKDHAMFIFQGQPLQGQSLEDVQKLFDEQIALVKQGKFEDWMLQATINNMKLNLMKSTESNGDRASNMAYAFVLEQDWQKQCDQIDELAKVTKQDIVAFANRIFLDNNYVVVNKLKGQPDPILKVGKPAITPIEVSRDKESAFLTRVKQNQAAPIEPRYVDFGKDLQRSKLKNGAEVLYVQNKENETFNLIYRYEFGNRAGELGKTLDLASDVLEYLGTSKHTAEQLQQEFYRLACNYNVSVAGESIQISVDGLNENMTQALALVEEIVTDCQPNEEAMKALIGRLLKQRADVKHRQNACFSALSNYGIYGADNPTTDQLSEAQLKAYTCQQLTDALHQLFNYPHRVLYYGPMALDNFKSQMNATARPMKLKAPANKKFIPKAVSENTVYFVDYNANQTYLREYFRGEKFNMKNYPMIRLFNEYFGGSMNAIVFQEMREKRSLAYSASSYYVAPNHKEGYYTNSATIATQNDKLLDAVNAFNELFDQMPEAESNFDLAKETLISECRTHRTTKMDIIRSYLTYEKMGYDTKRPIEQMLLEAYPLLTMQDVVNFNHKNIKGQKKIYMCLGKESDMDFNALSKYGKVQKLTLEEIFGY